MYSDWESSLTELSSDEDEYLPSNAPKKKAPPRKVKTEYNVTNALRPYRTTTYTAKSLYDQIIDNTIHLDPEYQRDIVWSEAKQSGLIDSLLRNYYIPPVLFAVTTHDDGSHSRVCIDGKQRLTSIQLFMDGLIPHKDNVSGKKYWYKPAAGEKRFILPKPLMQAFANKQITCIEYDGLLDDEEREIFQRVQLGVALTVAERMQAIPGYWPTLVREVQAIILGERGFGEDLDWGTDRGRDFQCLATIIYLIDSHPSTNTTFPGAVKLEKWLQTNKPVPESMRAAVLETFHIFVALVKDKKYKIAFQKPLRVAPVEFSVIGLLIYINKDKFSLMQLSQAIWELRADVRKEHDDVRANSKVTKTLFKFLYKGLKQLNLRSDGKGDTPAAVVIREKLARATVDGDTVDDDMAETSAPKVKKEKRRRAQEPESTDNSDYEQARPKRRASMPSAASSSRASSSKTPAKTPVSRKISAPAVPAKRSASKAAHKTSANNSKTTRAAESSPAETTTSISSQATAMAPTKVISRTTRTALAAAGDMLFPPEPSASQQQPISIPLAAAMSRAKKHTKVPPKSGGKEQVVKMEVDPTPSIPPDPQDENAMAVDETSQEAQQATASTTVQSLSTPANSTTSTTPSTPAPRHASSGMTLPRPASLSVNTSVVRNSSTKSPSFPIPPPPPPLSAGPSPSFTGNVPRFAAMTIHDTRSPPTAPRSDRDRRRTSESEWDMDRGRERDRDRYDRGRDRTRELERAKDRELRDWERLNRDRRDGRSRESERDRYRYGRDRRKDW
ncbi:hypothetical protein L226DRAFT_538270 [Lentinus tigrinus ALCF2SS1-7]|uniref:GmrSD restriction endonucleases N-terminal domain-containing protein n=1 Tax=Lentinus tigrinus ALCF2SS1-6 TaxID=1328759 RepID=A0A5C2S092_9APHY|nr:hypothetical protein L227DRAFT_578463 [Lentinus tigrinus ALCF2SS1-6]RPD71134.1 hypothetical protein L226DRAFT_538270 [Lentinus tigrinus ALCF2SS1-7]